MSTERREPSVGPRRRHRAGARARATAALGVLVAVVALAGSAGPALAQPGSGHGGRPALAAAPTRGMPMGPWNGPAWQTSSMPGMNGGAMGPAASPPPFYRERTFLVLLGIGVAGAAFAAYRVGRARRRRAEPASFASEAVLAVDLVDSTHLATHYGEALAMRARLALQDRIRAAAERHAAAFTESTGDGSLMTFPSAAAAAGAAIALLQDLRDRPPDLAPGPALAVRAGISYGEVLVDARGGRHGAAINKAFRLEALGHEGFAQVGDARPPVRIPERDRVFMDEEAARELRRTDIPSRLVGFSTLKGFSGLHQVHEVLWEPGTASR